MEILVNIGLFLSTSYLLYWFLIGQYRSLFIEQKCTCGENKKCLSKIEIKYKGGSKRYDLLKCGKVKKQMKKMNDISFK